MTNEPYVTTMWANDFVQALYDRPKWARLLFRLSCGKHAHREFIGIVETMKDSGHYFMGDELTEIEYRREEVPLDWKKLLANYEKAF